MTVVPHSSGFPSRRLEALCRSQSQIRYHLSEEANTPDPVVMVQNYHFALLAAMIPPPSNAKQLEEFTAEEGTQQDRLSWAGRSGPVNRDYIYRSDAACESCNIRALPIVLSESILLTPPA